MRDFRDIYLDRLASPLHILDLGAQDVNGCFRSLFDRPHWQYQGLDMCPGKNVDIVLENPYEWKEVATGSADVVISGSTFEHIEYFWLTMQEVARVLKPGGLACIVAPSSGPEHRYPVDCWRFYPDGLLALARYAGLEVLKAETDWAPKKYEDRSEVWKDSVLICRKPSLPDQSCLTAHHPLLNVRPAQPGHEDIHLVCVSHKPDIFSRYVLDNPHLRHYAVTQYDNRNENTGVAERYNHFIQYRLPEISDGWIIFLHHDVQFEEDPGPMLDQLDRQHIYGPIGAFLKSPPPQRQLAISRRAWWRPKLVRRQYYHPAVAGEVGCNPVHETIKGSGKCGVPISSPTLVDTLDCCCLIVHSSLIRQHSLRFDNRFARHLYSEDFSLVARQRAGIKTFAANFSCSHFSDTTQLDETFRDHLTELLAKHPAVDFASTCYAPSISRQHESESREWHFSIPNRLGTWLKI